MIEAVAATVQEWYSQSSEKEGILMVTTTRGPTGQPAVVVFIFFNGDEEEGKRRFKKIIDLGPVANLAGMIPYERLNAMQNEAIPYNINCFLNGITRGSLPPSSAAAIFSQMMALANAPSQYRAINPTTKEEEPNTLAIVILWEFWNLKKQSTPSPDATAYRMRVPYPVAPMGVFWSSDDSKAGQEAKERLKALKMFCDNELRPTFGTSGPSVNGTGYGNAEMVSGAKSLYADNYPRLQSIKAKYDPNLMFKAWYPIQPAAAA